MTSTIDDYIDHIWKRFVGIPHDRGLPIDQSYPDDSSTSIPFTKTSSIIQTTSYIISPPTTSKTTSTTTSSSTITSLTYPTTSSQTTSTYTRSMDVDTANTMRTTNTESIITTNTIRPTTSTLPTVDSSLLIGSVAGAGSVLLLSGFVGLCLCQFKRSKRRKETDLLIQHDFPPSEQTRLDLENDSQQNAGFECKQRTQVLLKKNASHSSPNSRQVERPKEKPMNTKPTSSNYQPFVQQWNGDVAVHSEPSYHQSGAYDNQPRVYRAETYNPPNQFSRNSEMTPILSKSLYGKEYYETDRPIQSYYDQRLQSNSESHPNVSSRNISPQNQKNPNFQQNPSEESHHSSIIQPLFLFTEYGFSGESLDLVLNYFYPLSTRLNAVDDYIDQNIKIHLGDVLMIEEHLKNGFCRGHNITQQTAGYFPLKILLPNSTIPFRFIDCYKQKSTVIGKPLPSIIKYLMEFNPPLLTINSIDMEKITESDLYPIFSTLKGDEKCLVHGEQEFTEFMMYFLKVFGDGFWKSLDISQLT